MTLTVVAVSRGLVTLALPDGRRVTLLDRWMPPGALEVGARVYEKPLRRTGGGCALDAFRARS